MSAGTHNHYAKYYVREVKNEDRADYLELICLSDGLVFEEIKIVYRLPSGEEGK